MVFHDFDWRLNDLTGARSSMDLGSQPDKVAVVTGGSRGLGFAAAQAIAAEGAHVVICARGTEQLQRAVEQLRSGSTAGARAEGVVADVSTEDGVRTVIDARRSAAFGRLDVLVNNVGSAKGADIESTTDAEWQEAFDQTLFPAIRATRLAVPHLRTQRRRHRHRLVDLRPRSRAAA